MAPFSGPVVVTFFLACYKFFLYFSFVCLLTQALLNNNFHIVVSKCDYYIHQTILYSTVKHKTRAQTVDVYYLIWGINPGTLLWLQMVVTKDF
jgi:hypothetical protein